LSNRSTFFQSVFGDVTFDKDFLLDQASCQIDEDTKEISCECDKMRQSFHESVNKFTLKNHNAGLNRLSFVQFPNQNFATMILGNVECSKQSINTLFTVVIIIITRKLF